MMSVPVIGVNRFIPHCTIPADLPPKVMVEVGKVVDDPENIRRHALWFGYKQCWLIAKNLEEYELGADCTYNLGALVEDTSIAEGAYVFASVSHNGGVYYAWFHLDSNELVAVHNKDCDLMQEVAVVAVETVWFDDCTRTERWSKQGKTLVFSVDVWIRANFSAVSGPLMTILSALDSKAMTAQQIADRLNAELDAWRVHAESLDFEPNYAMLPPSVDVAEHRVGVTSCYRSQWVHPEKVFEKVKLPQYMAAGVDLDLAEVLEGFPLARQSSGGRRSMQRKLKP